MTSPIERGKVCMKACNAIHTREGCVPVLRIEFTQIKTKKQPL